MNSAESETILIDLPEVNYFPLDDLGESFLQFSTLKEMGYPVEIEIIDNDDPRMMDYFNNSYLDMKSPENVWELEVNPKWVMVTIDPKLNKYIETLGDAGEFRWGSEHEVQDYLMSHPVKMIWQIADGDIGSVVKRYQDFLEGSLSPYDISHRRDDFPWDNFLQKCVVAAGNRYKKLMELGDPHLDYPYETESYKKKDKEAMVVYNDILQRNVEPINGEQLAGLVTDYYRMVEEASPEFAALSKITKSNPTYL